MSAASPTPLAPSVLVHIAQLINVPLKSLVATIELLDEGATVPFIARYRKEATGNLDEVQIRDTQEKLEYFRELEDRRASILQSIQEQGKLTDELRKKIEATMEKNELEDLYLPYKPKRRTKASIARDKGLEPLANFLWEQAEGAGDLYELAATFVSAEKEVNSIDEALEGARHIIAEVVSENADFRKKVRAMMAEGGMVVSRRIEGVEDPESKYTQYYEFREPASKIPSHRMLAIRRGAKEGVLHFEIELESAGPVTWLESQVIKSNGDTAYHLRDAITDSYERLLNPSIQTEVRLELKDRSDEDAIKVFRDNLENLLLSPPAGMLSVIGIDPGIRTGCKIAVVDNTGKFLEHSVIYPHEPKNDLAGSVKTLASLIARHNVQALAIGNGTASRETSAFVNDFLRQAGLSKVFSVVVSESGASVYSASDVARQEFPDLDLTVRGAISIARRLQDPLAELVKVDPKSIGVGQYQHDVDQRRLKQSLEATVESCVNRVGVDLNTASVPLLRHVSGLNERTAQNIVEFRNQNGRFRNRKQLMEVSGLGPKTFQLAAGFLRIRGGDNPLDVTAVHPESYDIVEKIADSLKVSLADLIANPKLIENVDIQAFRTEQAGSYTLTDIKEELRKPGRDPRDTFQLPSFRDDVKEIVDLKPGMQLEGVITNVTRFGAFVDIGVHQDGLVHVSELSNRFVKDPAEFVKAGQIVKVQVLTADPKTKRVALSMKACEPKPAGGGGGSRPPQKGQPAPKQQPPKKSLEDQLAALNTKFRTR
ncbi:MAG: RNA-binding transcriptional accessory protein [Bryobacterales bacterium]|nr:RNA-binding transcriptional accessory protein [Bryobacterales bacterium]